MTRLLVSGPARAASIGTRWVALLLGTVLLTVVLGVSPAAADPVAPPPTGTAEPDGLSESEAMTKAEATGEPVVASDLTTETRVVTADPDSNQFVAEMSPVPVRVERGGEWVDIDPDLHRQSDGSVTTASTAAGVTAGGSGGLVARVELDGASVSLRWPTALPAPQIRGEVAVWPNVRPDIDLAVRSNAQGIEQYVVVRTAAAAHDPWLASYQLGVDAPGLSVTGNNGGFLAKNAAGETAFVGSAPRMWESPVATTGDPVDVTTAAITSPDAADNASAPVAMTVTDRSMTLVPSQAFLFDPTTQFPVVIDPSLSALPTASRHRTNWGMVWSDGQEFWNDSSQLARVGYDGWQGNKKSRAFYTFDTAQFKGVTVTEATFAHKQTHSTRGCDVTSGVPGVGLYITGAIDSSLTWSNQPDWHDLLDTANTAHGNDENCPGWDRTEWDVRAGVQKSADLDWNTITLGLKSADEGDKYGWRKFANDDGFPVLSITYDRAPSVPAAPTVSPVTNYKGTLYSSDSTPSLSVKVSDPDGGTVRAGFYTDIWGASDEAVLQNSAGVSSGGTASITKSLANGSGYWVVARADDGVLQSAKGAATLVMIDTTAPATPAVTGPTANPKVGDTASFTLTGPSSDTAYYVWGYDTDTPSTKVEPTTLGGNVTVKATIGQFGPQWVSAYTLDRAGNRSATTRFQFKVDPTDANHRYALDGAGTDVPTAATAAALTVPAAATWGPGRDATYVDGTMLDCTDKALTSTSSTGTTLTTAADPANTTAAFSVSAWVKPTSDLATVSTTTGNESMAAALYTGSTAAVSLGYRKTAATDTTGTWLLTLDTDGAYGGRATVPTTVPVSTTEWTLLVGVWSPFEKKAYFYINDQPAASVDMPTAPFDATRLMAGGAPAGGTTVSSWKGSVDEVNLFPGVLDAGEVKRLYNKHRDPNSTC